jgi:hypothetical protein
MTEMKQINWAGMGLATAIVGIEFGFTDSAPCNGFLFQG